MKKFLILELLLSGLLVSASAQSVYIHEGFNAQALPAGWTQIRLTGSQATWSAVGQGTNPYVAPYRGSGQAKFNSFDAATGEQARLVSRAISLTGATDPFLTFFLYHDDEYTAAWDSIYLEVTTVDSVAGPWTALSGHRRPASANGWTHEIVSLYPYRGAGRLFVGLRGVSKYGNNIFVDEFRVADSSFYDISTTGIISLSGTTAASSKSGNSRRVQSSGKLSRELISEQSDLAVYAGSPLILRAYLRNFGTSTASGYNIGWKINNQAQSPVSGPTLAPRVGRDSVTLIWGTPVAGSHIITAWTNAASDSNRKNDTARIQVHVLDTATVFFESFNGGSFPPTGWLTINRDGGAAAPWFRGTDTSAFVAFEGTGYAANNFQRANGTYLDDYLITPPIAGINPPGRADSLYFWVRSPLNSPPLANFPDSLMVMLSTTGADTSHFTTVLDYFSVPKGTWTRKGYSLQNRVTSNTNVRIAFRYLLQNVLPNAGSGDFIGLDAVQLVRKLPTGINLAHYLPAEIHLEQNYPNPFNPSTTIRFSIPETRRVRLFVLDVLGQKVATMLDDVRTRGEHSITFNAQHLSSGVYFYRLETKGFTQTRPMLYIK